MYSLYSLYFIDGMLTVLPLPIKMRSLSQLWRYKPIVRPIIVQTLSHTRNRSWRNGSVDKTFAVQV